MSLELWEVLFIVPAVVSEDLIGTMGGWEGESAEESEAVWGGTVNSLILIPP